MPKDQHRAKYCEELACRRHDAASQWAKIRHRQENKILQINVSEKFTTYHYTIFTLYISVENLQQSFMSQIPLHHLITALLPYT